MRTVVIVACDNAMGLDITGPAEVFDTANRLHGGEPQYRVEMLAIPGGAVTLSTGISLHAKDARRWLGPIDTLIVTGGYGIHNRGPHDELVQWVRRYGVTPLHAKPKDRIVSPMTMASPASEVVLSPDRMMLP